jgi:LPPG:FO 2-phospho-L-lactate transferase
VCPSNPITSIGPILAVPGVVEALASTRAAVIGVSPIVAGGAVSGPAAALMQACELPASTIGVARAYAPWLRRLLIDPRDARDTANLARLGVTAVATDIMMPDRDREIALARRVLDLP